MPTQTPSTKFTYEDYLLFPNDGKRYQLIGGDRFVTPAPRMKHQRISGYIYGFLFDYVYKTKCGILFSAPTDVVLSELDVVQPDILFIASNRSHIMTEANIQGAPDLVVEILSESTRRTDEIIKRKLYERYKVQEYWVIDPELETVKIYRLTVSGYDRPLELSAETSDTLTTPLFTSFKIPLQDLFQ